MEPKPGSFKNVSSRILALDYLRGFFIVVIIVDHLWRWPNIFQYVSGRGELWASAAEGFVIISGLLVGYIRGYKNRSKPLKDISRLLITRGIMLYIWMFITTMLLVGASWLLNFQGSMAHIPLEENNWWLLVVSALRLDYVHTLTHFLYLYAIFLVIAPLVIWLMRKGKSWVVGVASVVLWYMGVLYSIEWLQWQVLFFVPAIAGYYLETIQARYRQLSRGVRRIIRYGSVAAMGATVLVALMQVLAHQPGAYQNILFGRHPITIGTILISFVWFVGLLSLVQFILPWLRHWLGWLLLTFGERSLTAYILHTVPLVLCSILLANYDNFIVNSLLAASCIVLTWLLVKIPNVNRIIPR